MSYTEREKEMTQRRQRECGIRVCALSKKEDRQDSRREARKGLRAHEREKECAPTKKAYMLGLWTHLGVATRLARMAFAIHFAHI